jgi:ferric-dicitrate binding protein FerR (iron transport regulator)
VELNEQQTILITKGLNSDISEDEKLILESELSENLELRQVKEIIHKFWFKYFPKTQTHQIIQKTETKLGFISHSNSSFSFGFFYKVAATVLLILSLAFIAYQQFKPSIETSLNQYVTEQGKVRSIVLSDGTKVWLNSHSVLIASEPFVDEIREVLLVGEGYFEVAHNANKPFIIKTPFLKTKVLGTNLNIAAYPGDDKLDVTLYEGKVELADAISPHNKLVMKPGEKTSFSINEKQFYSKQNYLEKPAEWRDGVIRFYDEDLNSIAKKLERKFMTRIFIVDDEVGKLNFTASFDTEPLDKILKLLSEAHGFKTITTANGIIIKSFKNNI